MRNLGLGDLAFLGAVGGVAYDADAAAYIAAVEAADGQALEAAVKDAIDAFVRGCKADGIWAAIKASCILAGARTLAGALVPLVGPAPTNNNFVAGDYNRKTGIVTNGSKYIDSKYSLKTLATLHLSIWRSTAVVGGNGIIGAYYPATSSGNNFRDDGSTKLNMREVNTSASLVQNLSSSGFLGGSFNGSLTINRSNKTNVTRVPATVVTETQDANVFIFARNEIGSISYAASGNRISFYSIGEAVDLALLDARVTTLINALSTAIP